MENSKVCKVCGKPLKLGKFAYNQEICWDCFKYRVIDIVWDLEGTENKEIVIHLLNCLAEAQGIKKEDWVNKPPTLTELIRDIVRKEILETAMNFNKGAISCDELDKRYLQSLNRDLAFALNMPEDSLEYVLKDLKLKVVEA